MLFDAGIEMLTSVLSMFFLILYIRSLSRTLYVGLRALWGKEDEGTREERKKKSASMWQTDGASIAMRHGRMHLAQTYQIALSGFRKALQSWVEHALVF